MNINPTHDEVSAILRTYEQSLEISPAELLELANFTGIEPNFSGLVTLRDQMRDNLPPSLARYTDPRDELVAIYREKCGPDKRIEAPRVDDRLIRGMLYAMLFTAIGVAVVVAAIWIGGKL